jgi:hypothetical protein
MTKKELKELIRKCLYEQGKLPVNILQPIGPVGPDYGPGSGEYPNYDWNENPMGLNRNDWTDPRVLRRLPPRDQWIKDHGVARLRPPNYPGERPGGTYIQTQPSTTRQMHDYEVEKRRIAIKNQNAHREKAAKEREDSLKFDAQLKRQRKKEDTIINMLIVGAVLAFVGPIIFSMIKENDNSENNNLESGKEVKVKTPISRIEKNANTPVEKTFLDKVKSKIPQYFTVKYNSNLGKKVDLDFKKVMVTVSDLNLAKSLVNAGTNLNEDNTSTDVSIKDLLKIAKTQGVDGLENAAEKIASK